MTYINAWETPLHAHKFTRRYMEWTCPECEYNCKSRWELYASDCAYNHVPVTCKQCKGDFEVVLPNENTDKYLEGLKLRQDSKDYYIKELEDNLQRKKNLEKELNYAPTPYIESYDYDPDDPDDQDYLYDSDNFESENEQEWNIIYSNIKSLEQSLENQREAEEHYKKEHQAPFHEMIIKNYSNPKKIPNTLCVDACWKSETQFAYKCTYCNCIHIHGCGFIGVNKRTTHCRMELPRGIRHYSVEVTISDTTPRE